MLCAIILFAGVAIAAAPGAAPAAPVKKQAVQLTVQGFRIGMTRSAVKEALGKRKVAGYETGFSDLFVYRTSPDTDIQLAFACSSKGPILSSVILNTIIENQDLSTAAPKYREMLISKYGAPTLIISDGDSPDFCWGRCAPDTSGVKLQAKLLVAYGAEQHFVVSLIDDSLAKTCAALRQKKINRWLSQWIAGIQKFRPGATMDEAAKVYSSQYKEKMVLDAERESGHPQYPLSDYVVKNYDFFTALDPDSRVFEGEGPGSVILKFTGDQAGRGDRSNRRLYYVYFSTTRFTNNPLSGGLQQKLERFIKVYGEPREVFPQPGSLYAVWEQRTVTRKLEIHDSGLMIFEQYDLALKEAYRNKVIRKVDQYRRSKYDRSFF